MTNLAFPKPKEARKDFGGVRTTRDGREICNLRKESGRKEYKRRLQSMLDRQGGLCCLQGFIRGCTGALRIEDATFEHEYTRGMGGSLRDDRIEKDGKPFNGAAHARCNRRKGSKRIAYNKV